MIEGLGIQAPDLGFVGGIGESGKHAAGIYFLDGRWTGAPGVFPGTGLDVGFEGARPIRGLGEEGEALSKNSTHHDSILARDVFFNARPGAALDIVVSDHVSGLGEAGLNVGFHKPWIGVETLLVLAPSESLRRRVRLECGYCELRFALETPIDHSSSS